MDTITDSPATTSQTPTTFGVHFAGGFYAGRILVDGVEHALVVAPKGEGEHEDAVLLEDYNTNVEGALSFYDGLKNTEAFAAAGSELAKWARGLRIGGFDDWYLPSRDELELLYRAFKPTAEENYCGSGDNPSSVPVGYAYSRGAPAQTAIEAFRSGGAEAFDDDYYWGSTQYAGDEAYAWFQSFGYGRQGNYHKDGELRARAVRRLKI